MPLNYTCLSKVTTLITCRFVELGGNFLDTANVYSQGESEEIIGSWLERIGPKREEIVVATKAR